jgi:hypothetical protein
MHNPVHFISPLLLSAFSILLFCCGKEEPPPTVVTALVTDKKTGKPIEGAKVYVEFYSNNSSGTKEITSKSILTDANGKAHISHETNCDGTLFSTVTRKGYNTKAHLPMIRCGDSNHIEVKLIPQDGVLKINIENVTGQNNSIWVALRNPSYSFEANGLSDLIFLQHFPLSISQGELYSEYFDLTSEEYTSVFWGYENFMPTYNTANFCDSVYINLSDTTVFFIAF